tara:strand:- start:4300 stop:4977 length:678 start_codon:yes stop_codon:yes gene_type:complete
MSSVCTVILARLGSSRLPKKMIKKFGEKTILDFILNRARNLDNWPNVILATTDLDQDDELEEIAKSHNIDTYRGSVDDVASRFIEAANKKNAKWINRVNGDNVFFDYEKINYGIKLIKKMQKIEIISNVNENHIPGFSVELISKDVMSKAYKEMNLFQKEHVTKFFYENVKNYNIHWLSNEENLSALAIDSIEDFNKAVTLLNEPYSFSHSTSVLDISESNVLSK